MAANYKIKHKLSIYPILNKHNMNLLFFICTCVYINL